MATTLETAEFATVADLLERIGDVDARRVRLVPPPGTATVEDVVRLNEIRPRAGYFELVDGTIVEKGVMGFEEGTIAATLAQLIGNFLDEFGGGLVNGADGMMQLTERTTRVPDVSFVAAEQFPDGKLPGVPCPELFPDLAVEVVSVGNRPGEMRRKRDDYFAAGTRLVWQIDSRRRTIEAYTSPEECTVHGEDDPVGGGEVLPGFQVTLAELIERTEKRLRPRS